jgi:hypothetical protein
MNCTDIGHGQRVLVQALNLAAQEDMAWNGDRHVLSLSIIWTGVINLLTGGGGKGRAGKGPEWSGSFEEEERNSLEMV